MRSYIAEEVLFRGLIQQRASQVMHPVLAAGLSVGLYLCLSVGHGSSYLNLLFALLLGSTVSYIYYKKANLVLTYVIKVTAKLVYIGLVAGFIFR